MNGTGSKHALAEAQSRAEALTSLGMVLFTPTTNYTHLRPSVPFSGSWKGCALLVAAVSQAGAVWLWKPHIKLSQGCRRLFCGQWIWCQLFLKLSQQERGVRDRDCSPLTQGLALLITRQTNNWEIFQRPDVNAIVKILPGSLAAASAFLETCFCTNVKGTGALCLHQYKSGLMQLKPAEMYPCKSS